MTVVKKISISYLVIVSVLGIWLILKNIYIIFFFRKTIIASWYEGSNIKDLINYFQIGLWSFIFLIELIFICIILLKVARQKSYIPLVKKNDSLLKLIIGLWVVLTVTFGIIESQPVSYYLNFTRLFTLIAMVLLFFSNRGLRTNKITPASVIKT